MDVLPTDLVAPREVGALVDMNSHIAFQTLTTCFKAHCSGHNMSSNPSRSRHQHGIRSVRDFWGGSRRSWGELSGSDAGLTSLEGEGEGRGPDRKRA